MNGFKPNGRYFDNVSSIAFSWTVETNSNQRNAVIHMTADRGRRRVQVDMPVIEEELIRYDEQILLREAMARAERMLNTTMPEPKENTAGVLRHLVQMAKAVAA